MPSTASRSTLDDVGLGPAQLAHGGEASVPADDAAGGGVDHERLGLAEAAQAGHDRGHVLLAVPAGVGGVGVQRVERDAAEGERAVQGGVLRVERRASWNWGLCMSSRCTAV
jgi:hypothetical protein